MKIDAKAKRIIKKNNMGTCGYIYKDGIVIKTVESHIYKGNEFRKDIIHKIPGVVKIYYTDSGKESFQGRLVMHNASLMLDGIESIKICLNNKSETMKKLNLTCNTITIKTESGLKIYENQFSFLNSDITIQDDKKQSIDDY